MSDTSSPGAASRGSATIDIADDLLSRLNQALAGAADSEADTSPHHSTCRRPATSGGERYGPANGLPLGELGSPGRPGNLSAGEKPTAARPHQRPHSAGGLRGWGDGQDDDVDEVSCRDVEEEEYEDQVLISLEIREARSVPAAVTRSTGECYVELQRRTVQGTFARLNPAQSRVRSVKTSRVKRTWGDTKSDRVVRWSGGQCIDVVASCKDSLMLSLWDYKTIGNDVKVGVARIECAELPLSSEKVFYHFPICNRCGQEVKGSNGQCAQISVAISTSPITTEIPVEKEWSEDAAASAAERNPSKQCPAPASDVPCKAAPLMTPVLDAVMIKLGSHCEHGGEALTFLGLDADGRVSARQLAAGMDRIGHPRLDLETLGRELQTGRDNFNLLLDSKHPVSEEADYPSASLCQK